jgi:carboxypeptidase Taq
MKKNIDFDETLMKGELNIIKDWLDTHIHQYGSYYFPKELIEKATGQPLNPEYFLQYLKEKYAQIYPGK